MRFLTVVIAALALGIPAAAGAGSSVSVGVQTDDHGACVDWFGPEIIDDDPNMVGVRDNDAPNPLGLPGAHISADGGHSCEGWFD